LAERVLTYSAALNEALREEMHRDPSVFLMGEDLCTWGDDGGVFGVTKGLAKEFGLERVRDTPISEQGFVALGVGAAVTGMRPVVELMYGDFLTLAMEPLVNQAAKIRYMFGGQVGVPLVVRTNIGASGGKAAQHSQSLEAWLMHVPGLKVAVPRTPADAKGLLTAAIRDDNPVIFLEHKLLYFTKGPVPAGEHLVPFGKAATIRSGSHLTIVGTHVMVDRALEAASELQDEGIEAEVIDLRTLVPLDVEAIVESVGRTTRLLICHESVERAGWAGEVAMAVMEHAFDVLDAPIARVCGKNVPIPYSESLEPLVVPQVAEIAAAARALLAGVDIPSAALAP
jgi:pyruvate/2-oxoglutarate/acetoin dehydrogenase E1 component